MIHLEQNGKLIPSIDENTDEGNHELHKVSLDKYDTVMAHMKNTNIRLKKINDKLDCLIESVDNLLNKL